MQTQFLAGTTAIAVNSQEEERPGSVCSYRAAPSVYQLLAFQSTSVDAQILESGPWDGTRFAKQETRSISAALQVVASGMLAETSSEPQEPALVPCLERS